MWVEHGSTVLAAAKRADVVVPAPCGGRGVCGSCGVRIISGGVSEPDAQELEGLRRAPAGVRLACRARIEGACEIRPLVRQTVDDHTTGQRSDVELVAGVDLGTTSVAAVLVDPLSGRELARASVPNRQQAFGADVLTRMSAALAGSSAELRAAAEDSIVLALDAAAALGGVNISGVRRLVIAANSAMIALLLGADVASLAVAPFNPPSNGGDLAADSPVRARISPNGDAFVLPPVAGFVGGDALAAVLAAGLSDAIEPALLIDFGTNAEIVLAGCGSLIVASAAAGPAFEGAGIACGGPAAEGAVTSVRIEPDGVVSLTAMGSEPPRWFSGSGIVSAVAELRRVGHISDDGLLLEDGPLADRIGREDGVLTVALGGPEGCLVVSQLDIRALQLAKAAVHVGVTAVLDAAGVRADALHGVLVAGAFGSGLNAADLVDLGVIPAETLKVVRSVGNAALEGAVDVALDPALAGTVARLAESAVHVDLATDPGFAAALMLGTRLEPFSASR